MPAIFLTPQLFVRIAAPDEIGMYVALVEIGRFPLGGALHLKASWLQ